MTLPLLAAASALASSSCIFEAHIPRDYWSEIIDACDYLIPRARSFPYPPKDETSLTPACRAALAGILPFHESFKNAPAGLKDHVLEAFQVIAAYPLALPPENTIFGVAPYSIPLASLCLFDPGAYPDECRIDADYEAYLYEIPDGDPRRISRNVFNRALNRFDEIRYDGGDEGAYASLVPFVTDEGTSYRLTIYNPFWEKGSYSLGNSAFERAATLVHESRHGDGYHHNVPRCDDADCDTTLAGCYGTEAIYRLMLIKGSYGLKAGDLPAMTNWDAWTLGYYSCASLVSNLEAGRLPPELAQFLENEQCTLTVDEILESLGLENAYD